MDRPLCESCIHWEPETHRFGICTNSPETVKKTKEEHCSKHHRFPQYLNFVLGQEQEAEREAIRKRNERFIMLEDHWEPVEKRANATDRPCPALGAIADVISEDEGDK
jgi:hypothetical protein